MANAQDEAFQRLLTQRGLVDARALQAARKVPGNSLVHSLLLARAVSHQDASGLLRELAQGSFRCPSCQQVLAYEALAFLDQLHCPRCRVPLEIRAEAPPPVALSGTAQPQASPAQRGAAVGKRIGPYVLLKELGRGSNGVVFLAERAGLKRQFALKVLLSTSFADEEAIARFKLEAAVASKLDETGVIGVYDIGRDGGHYYYAMEYCPGITLADLIQQGPLDPERAAKIVAELAQTVHHAHAMGVIHRDLKPANVMLDKRSGRARITDFGLARAPDLGQGLTRTGDVLGTPYYMAPEQLRGGAKVEPTVDIYALGVLLYEALAGERPFEAPTVVELSKLVQESQPVPLSKRAPNVPEELEAICKRAMAKRPWARYRNAQELADDLERFLAGEIPLAVIEAPSREAVVEAAPSGPPRALFTVLLTVMLVATGVVVGVAVHRRSQRDDAARDPAATAPVGELDPAELELALAQVRDAARALEPTPALLSRLEALVSSDPAQQELLRVERGELLMRRGRYAECIQVLGSQALAQPELARRRLWALGASHERLEQKADALRCYGELAEAGAGTCWGALGAAAAHRQREQWEEAFARARAANELDPDHAGALVELSLQTLLIQRDAARAEALLRRAREQAPDDQRVLIGLAVVLEQRANAREARTLLDEAVTLGGDQPTTGALVARARDRLVAGEVQGAQEDVERALQVAGEADLALRFLRGVVRWRTEQRLAAREDWDAAYQEDANAFRRELAGWPNLAEQVQVRQVLRLDEHGIQQRRVLFEVDEALRERLRKRAAYAGEAREALTEGLIKAAEGFPWSMIEPHFAQAEAAVPDSRIVALERVRILVGREEYDLALRGIARARELGADPAELLRLEGEVWYTRGKQHVAAEQYWDVLASKGPAGGLEGFCAMARTLGARGEAYEAQALEAAERALAIDPNHPASLLAKAVLLDPTKPAEEQEVRRILERILAEQGYLDAQVLHLRIALAMAPIKDKTVDKDDMWVLEKILDVYDDWALVASGASHLIAAAQLIVVFPKAGMTQRAERYLQEARAVDPERGTPWMYLGLLRLIKKELPPESDVLAYWQRAKEVEPKITIPPDWVEIYRERYKDTSRLEALGIPVNER